MIILPIVTLVVSLFELVAILEVIEIWDLACLVSRNIAEQQKCYFDQIKPNIPPNSFNPFIVPNHVLFGQNNTFAVPQYYSKVSRVFHCLFVRFVKSCASLHSFGPVVARWLSNTFLTKQNLTDTKK
ncbi:hypothetical protein BpHYR1_037045 [Brachionus plicatilis]|uniref:Secreted protein n=1 Tax=Brachionus plicatilis TaxID=10195 RepID=A0A3M7SN37_BRAPC|nr:hypothetical protein BpHYR1_037045 [Brachionus plicatilis]